MNKNTCEFQPYKLLAGSVLGLASAIAVKKLTGSTKGALAAMFTAVIICAEKRITITFTDKEDKQ